MNTKPVSLLIVDDDPVFAHFVRQMVLSLGKDFPSTVRLADSAEQARTALRESEFDLMLLDYHLPDADGLQIIGEIRDLSESQPAVIMLTGSGNETVAVEAMKRGAKDYLIKAGLDVAPLLRALRSALSQKRLADEVATYNAQTRADLEMARHLQQSLLPDDYPSFPPSVPPEQSALRFFHRFCPASELAGDFFSVLRLSDTQAGVFLCDVMGHGVRSALVTAMVRALVDACAAHARRPAPFLSEMNQRILRLLKPAENPMFATAFYLVADAATGHVNYATAGHPPPLHLHPGAGCASALHMPPHAGPALGLFANASYITSQESLTPGDVLLLFTDGLFEVTNPDTQEEYGRERLLTFAQEHIALTPPELCDALIASVRNFAQGAALSDDVCLLSMEFTGSNKAALAPSGRKAAESKRETSPQPSLT